MILDSILKSCISNSRLLPGHNQAGMNKSSNNVPKGSQALLWNPAWFESNQMQLSGISLSKPQANISNLKIEKT